MSTTNRGLRLKRFLVRNRVKIQDLALLAGALLVTTYVLLEVDVFVTNGLPLRGVIEPDEMPIIGAVLCLGLLIFAWRRSNEQRRETARRIAAEQRSRELALQDPLTGLPNRRRFDEALRAAIGAPPGGGGAHALLLLDLNGFKQVNDVYGHGSGDEALIIIGERLCRSVREGDLVARLGGDEFGILAQHLTGPEAATGIALRAIDAISAPISIANVRHRLGTGVGICLFPFDQSTPQEIMRRADVALYKAKSDHKSSLRFFDAEMDRHVREREFMERELREAIARQDVRPFFQPLIDLKTQKIVGFEALARWTHKDLGDIPPERFIPIAEDSG